MITAEGAAQRQLYARAAEIRDRVFGRSVVVRGVVEITNICRVNCDYCPMRRDNTRWNAPYVLEPDAILTAARNVRDAGINVIVFRAERFRRRRVCCSRFCLKFASCSGGESRFCWVWALKAKPNIAC